MDAESARQAVREVIGNSLSEDEVDALLSTHAALARGLAAIAFAELKQVQPPLQSMPGPGRP
jgi:hypothetical protein